MCTVSKVAVPHYGLALAAFHITPSYQIRRVKLSNGGGVKASRLLSERGEKSGLHVSVPGNMVVTTHIRVGYKAIRSKSCRALDALKVGRDGAQLNLALPPPNSVPSLPCTPCVSMMQSGSGARDHLTDKCIRAPGAAALALAISDPASSRGSFLLTLNLAFQK